jgi:hypothetical protein
VQQYRDTIDSFGEVKSSVLDERFSLSTPVKDFQDPYYQKLNVNMFVGLGERHVYRGFSVDAKELWTTPDVEKTLTATTDLDQERKMRRLAEEVEEAKRQAERSAHAAKEAARLAETQPKAAVASEALAKTPRQETVMVNGRSVTFVRDPSIGCNACLALCVAAAQQAGVCGSAASSTTRALGGLGGLLVGVAVGSICDQEVVNKPCARLCCPN